MVYPRQSIGETRPAHSVRVEAYANPTTINTRDELRNVSVTDVSVTEADAARKADLNWRLDK